MSYSTDDQRILGEIERGLTRDDPALAALIDTLNQQFPETPEQPDPSAAAVGSWRPWCCPSSRCWR